MIGRNLGWMAPQDGDAEERNPDADYDNFAEKAIIADLEHVDELKAELAAWRRGPWVLKSEYDRLRERVQQLSGERRPA
jgi:hypothetical protein